MHLEEKVRGFERMGCGGIDDSGSGRDAFVEVKRAFAKKYHPNSMTCSGMEKLIRSEIFKEFWGEIERIEKFRK